jgi:signal transduction histidine kinase
MTLRMRLFVTGLLVALPLAVGWVAIDTRMRLAAKDEELRLSLDYDVANGLRERCEADPPRTGRPGRGGFNQRGGPPKAGGGRRGVGPPQEAPGPRLATPGGSGAYQFFAYDSTGSPTAADAPRMPTLGAGQSGTFWTSSGFGVEMVVRFGGEGPCATVLARIRPRPQELRDQAEALLLVVVSVLVAAWFAAGPVIRRLRRLADGVRQSAAAHYESPVTVDGGDEVASLASAFNDAGREVRAHLLEVQSREESLRNFVANTTHDVAIPLSVLQGHLTELDRRLSDPPQRAILQGAVQEAHYMTSLLRNLAAATRLDQPTAPLVRSLVDLSATVEHVVERHRPVARALGVELNAGVPDPPLVVTADSTLLEQALSNLVDNAVRYNRAGGHVAVVLDGSADRFVLSVTDDGPGVSDEELSKLTTRWFRGSVARTRRPDGKGLGLAIARESVERLGLSLVFSRPPAGGLRAEIRESAPPVSMPQGREP